MGTNRKEISGVFTDINEPLSRSSSDNNLSSSSADCSSDNSYLMSSSILLKFADRSLNAGLKSENATTNLSHRRRSKHSHSQKSMKKRISTREEMRVSLDLSATILKLHQIQMERECDKLSEDTLEKDSHVSSSAESQRVYSKNARRLTMENPSRTHSEHPKLRYTLSEPQKRVKTKTKPKPQGLRLSQSHLNSSDETQKTRVLPPVIGVICSSPTAQCNGYFNQSNLWKSQSFSPGSATPLSSTSLGNSSVDLRAALSLTPTSRSESDDAHSPLPSMKGTQKLERHKLPPISGKSSSTTSLTYLNLQSSFDDSSTMSNKNVSPFPTSPGENKLGFVKFSMMSSKSRSGSDDAFSPLPPLKRTPKVGRKTLPPIKRNDSTLSTGGHFWSGCRKS